MLSTKRTWTRRIGPFGLAIVLLCGHVTIGVPRATAEALGTWTLERFLGSSEPHLASMGIRLGAGTVPTLQADATVFDGLVFGEPDEGRTIVADEKSDAEFTALVDLLTNGDDDFALLCHDLPDGSGCTGTREADAYGANPDFRGATITSIHMTIDLLEFKSPGYKGATDVNLTVTFTVEGTPAVVAPPQSWGTLKSSFGAGARATGRDTERRSERPARAD